MHELRAKIAEVRQGMNSARWRSCRRWLFTIAIFVLWEAVCRVFKVDRFILPPPSDAFAAMVQYWRPLLRHSFVTLWTTMAGFAHRGRVRHRARARSSAGRARSIAGSIR